MLTMINNKHGNTTYDGCSNNDVYKGQMQQLEGTVVCIVQASYRSGPLLSGTVTLALNCSMGERTFQGRTGWTNVPWVQGPKGPGPFIHCSCVLSKGKDRDRASDVDVQNKLLTSWSQWSYIHIYVVVYRKAIIMHRHRQQYQLHTFTIKEIIHNQNNK